MIRKAILAIAAVFCSASAFSASLVFSPQSQTVSRACTINLSATRFVDVIGLDIEIVFDEDIVSCSSVQFVASALPGFSEFYRRIDNEGGSLEIVLLKQTVGGYTGGANSFLVLTFEPVSMGTAQISIRKSYLDGNPLLIDELGGGIEATVDTATVVAAYIGPIPVTKLYQNYPNPFNPVTTIRFDVSARSPVYLRIFDVNGRLVRVLIDGKAYEIGNWERKWDGKNDGGAQVQSGVYLCVYEACGRRMSSKLVILR
ncbi:MAG: FlgD immunoglobulin-like domain containing protein [Candidatus Krumholzibacteriia bacterium]